MDYHDISLNWDVDEGVCLCDDVNIEEDFRRTNENINTIRDDMEKLRIFILHLKKQHAVIEGRIQSLENNRDLAQKEPDKYSECESEKKEDVSVNNAGGSLQVIKCISATEFNILPKFTRGRLQLEQTNEIVDAYNKIIKTKYDLKNADDLVKTAAGGRRLFCTLAELRESRRVSAGADVCKAAAVLRFLGRIEDLRTADGRAALAVPVPQPQPQPLPLAGAHETEAAPDDGDGHSRARRRLALDELIPEPTPAPRGN